jgi:hypothetical protein
VACKRRQAKARWCSGSGKKPKITASLLEVSQGQECVIVGTLYKEMKLKPSILDEHHARAKHVHFNLSFLSFGFEAHQPSPGRVDQRPLGGLT